MKVYKFIFLTFLSFVALSCTSVSSKEQTCNVNDNECNKILKYCSTASDKNNCIEQLMFQLNNERNAPKCALEDKECTTAVKGCNSTLHPDACTSKIMGCSIESKDNFQACSQEVLCFEGSLGCLSPTPSTNSDNYEGQTLPYSGHGISRSE